MNTTIEQIFQEVSFSEPAKKLILACENKQRLIIFAYNENLLNPKENFDLDRIANHTAPLQLLAAMLLLKQCHSLNQENLQVLLEDPECNAPTEIAEVILQLENAQLLNENIRSKLADSVRNIFDIQSILSLLKNIGLLQQLTQDKLIDIICHQQIKLLEKILQVILDKEIKLNSAQLRALSLRSDLEEMLAAFAEAKNHSLLNKALFDFIEDHPNMPNAIYAFVRVNISENNSMYQELLLSAKQYNDPYGAVNLLIQYKKMDLLNRYDLINNINNLKNLKDIASALHLINTVKGYHRDLLIKKVHENINPIQAAKILMKSYELGLLEDKSHFEQNCELMLRHINMADHLISQLDKMSSLALFDDNNKHLLIHDIFSHPNTSHLIEIACILQQNQLFKHHQEANNIHSKLMSTNDLTYFYQIIVILNECQLLNTKSKENNSTLLTRISQHKNHALLLEAFLYATQNRLFTGNHAQQYAFLIADHSLPTSIAEAIVTLMNTDICIGLNGLCYLNQTLSKPTPHMYAALVQMILGTNELTKEEIGKVIPCIFETQNPENTYYCISLLMRKNMIKNKDNLLKKFLYLSIEGHFLQKVDWSSAFENENKFRESHWKQILTYSEMTKIPEDKKPLLINAYIRNSVIGFNDNRHNNTHTHSVHLGTDFSIWSLYQRYKNTDINQNLSKNLHIIFEKIKSREIDIKTQSALRALSQSENNVHKRLEPIKDNRKQQFFQLLQHTNIIKNEDQKAQLIQTLQEEEWLDLTLTPAMLLTWAYQTSMENSVNEEDVISQIIEVLYEIQRGGNMMDPRRNYQDDPLLPDSPICISGAANKICEIMASSTLGLHHFYVDELIIEKKLNVLLLEAIQTHCEALLSAAKKEASKEKDFIYLVQGLCGEIEGNNAEDAETIFFNYWYQHLDEIKAKLYQDEDSKTYKVLYGEEALEKVVHHYIPTFVDIDMNNKYITPDPYPTDYLKWFSAIIEEKNKLLNPQNKNPHQFSFAGTSKLAENSNSPNQTP